MVVERPLVSLLVLYVAAMAISMAVTLYFVSGLAGV